MKNNGERKIDFKEALAEVNKRYGKTLKRLADTPVKKEDKKTK